MATGWIKLHRDILDHWVLSDPVMLKVWIFLLLKVNHEERKISVNGKPMVIAEGQMWTSIRKLSVNLDLGINTVKRKLAILQSDGMIYVDSRKGIGTLLTVRNYGLYQGFRAPKKTTGGYTDGYTDGYNPGTLTDTPTDTQVDYKQEYKNYKNYKNDKELKNNGLPPDHPDYFEEV